MSLFHLKDGLISAMILGDGYLSKQVKSLRLSHTIPQRSYLKFKISLAEQVGYNCRTYNATIRKTSVGTYYYCEGTINGQDISKFYLYSLEQLVNQLNPLGLMIWWCDDGSLTVHQKKKGTVARFGYLNTQRFSLEENQLISNILYQKFGIETNIHIDSKSGLAKQDHYRIYLNATNMRRLIDIVREFIPWVPKNMLYKFNMQYVVNRNPDSPYLAKHYNF